MLEKIIPPQLYQTVSEAIASSIQGPITDAKPLSGGLSNALVVRLFTPDRSYLLKISKNENSMKRYPLLQLAAAAGVAPTLHYSDQENGISISDHIETIPGLNPQIAISSIARNLKLLHQIDISHIKDEGELRPVMEQAVNWFTQQPFIPEENRSALLSAFGTIQNTYPWQDKRRVLSHNDLNPGNVLFNPQQAWFVDWDAASINDPYVDLSIAAIFFAYTAELENELLGLYFDGKPSAYQLARFKILKQLCRLVYAEKILQIALINQPDAWQQIERPDTIELGDVALQLQTGQLSMNDWEGKFRYGMAMFNEGLRQLSGEDIASRIGFLDQSFQR